MSVDEAIHDLLNFSTDIRSVAVLDQGGEVVAAAPTAASDALGGTAAGLWAEAQLCAGLSDGTQLDHVVVQDETGAVGMVREGDRLIVAVTGPRPAVGLLLFDLRTCLRDAYPDEVEQ